LETTPSDGSATVIDAKGKHLTSGIIDEHSHIVSMELRYNTTECRGNNTRCVNSDDVNIYRELAGGVTTSQLHGSANPLVVSAIVKWKWGSSRRNVIKPTWLYKICLGENVKQSNWGTNNPTRFPQTRMGVEQFLLITFNALENTKQLGNYTTLHLRKTKEKHQE
jgi:hypothetical protein